MSANLGSSPARMKVIGTRLTRALATSRILVGAAVIATASRGVVGSGNLIVAPEFLPISWS